MSKRYLLVVSLAMIVVSVIGLAVFYTLRGGLPAKLGWDWPANREEPAKTAEVMRARALVDGKTRFLAGGDAVARFDRDPKDEYATRSIVESAHFHASAVIILFYISLAVGLLGLLRLRVRHVVAVGLGCYTLAILGGGALLIFTGASTLAAIMLTFMLLGFFGQLVGANLMPGADHPFVVAAEDELRALPPARRKVHIVKRLVGGGLLFVVGCAMTALSVAIHAGVVVVATGAIAGGLFMMSTPLIASLRLRVAR